MNPNKKSELASWLVKTKGLLNPADQEAEIAKMAAQCPAATATEKNLVDDVDKAYEVMLIQTGAGAVSPTEVSGAPAVKPTSQISAAEELQISKTLMAQSQDRANVSANTTIESYILDRPAPDQYIPAGTKGTIVEKGWTTLMEQINSGKYTVLPDDGEDVPAEKRIASTTNFNLLKAAAEKNEPVEVYIGGLNKRPIGYLVNKGTAIGSGTAPVQMTREQLEQFLIMETAGYIIASETKPGAKLRYIAGHADPTTPGQMTPSKTQLADANKKAAIEAGSYDVSRETTNDVVPTTVKSTLQFRVKVNGQTLKDGVTPKTITKRVSLKADIPTLQRKPAYIDVFGTGLRESNGDLLEVPTGDQAKKIQEAQRAAIAALRAKAQDPAQVADLADIADKLAAFDAPTSQAPSATL